MKRLLIGIVVVGFTASPAVGNECPALQAQIDAAFANRFDGTAANVRAIARDAWALHLAEKHGDSVAKYDEAAKAGKLELKHIR